MIITGTEGELITCPPEIMVLCGDVALNSNEFKESLNQLIGLGSGSDFRLSRCMATCINRSETNVELPTVNIPSSNAINMDAILVSSTVRWSDVGTIPSGVRTKV